MASTEILTLKEVMTSTTGGSSFPSVYKRFDPNDIQVHSMYAITNNEVYISLTGISDVQMTIADETASINYYLDYIKRFSGGSSSLTAIYYFNATLGSFQYGTNLWGASGTPYGIDDYDYLYTFSLDKRYFGDFITNPSSFTVNTALIMDEANSGLCDEADERWYVIIFNDYKQWAMADLYTGVIYLFSTVPLIIVHHNFRYDSNQYRKEINANCIMQPYEFTHSMNPTAFQDETKYLDKLHTDPELLKNGGLELGTTTNWSATYCSITSSTDIVYSGVYSLKTTFDDTAVTDSTIDYVTSLADTSVELYDGLRAEWYFQRGSITANSNFIFEVQQYDGANYVTTQTKTVSITSVPYNEWYRVVLYDNVEYLNNIRIRIRIDNNPGDNTVFYLDAVSLTYQKGSIDKTNLYITGIGLFNDDNECLVIARLAKPLRKSSYPLNIKLRMDLV